MGVIRADHGPHDTVVSLHGRHVYLAGRGARDLRVLEVGCSFGHNTEYLNDQSLVAEIHSFDVDPYPTGTVDPGFPDMWCAALSHCLERFAGTRSRRRCRRS